MDFISNGLFAIHVTDLDLARTFYRDDLGFRLIQDGDQQLVFETGRFRMYVNKDDREMAFVPSLEVANYEVAKGYLKRAGCEIVRDWPQDKALYFKDPL